MTITALPSKLRARWVWLALLATPGVLAQSVCSSDGQVAPTALLERFISADCAACWRDSATPSAADTDMALDWIAPSTLGDDAPLSAAASRDALARLQAVHQDVPAAMTTRRQVADPLPGALLRVAHGVSVGNYVGASIELRLPAGVAAPLPLQAWLVLVEALPTGTEQSPVARNLVRNVFQPTWETRDQITTTERTGFKDLRAIAIPEGTRPARMRVLGWVEDNAGRVIATAQSSCLPDEDD